jgi:hypothetical protein
MTIPDPPNMRESGASGVAAGGEASSVTVRMFRVDQFSPSLDWA